MKNIIALMVLAMVATASVPASAQNKCVKGKVVTCPKGKKLTCHCVDKKKQAKKVKKAKRATAEKMCSYETEAVKKAKCERELLDAYVSGQDTSLEKLETWKKTAAVKFTKLNRHIRVLRVRKKTIKKLRSDVVVLRQAQSKAAKDLLLRRIKNKLDAPTKKALKHYTKFLLKEANSNLETKLLEVTKLIGEDIDKLKKTQRSILVSINTIDTEVTDIKRELGRINEWMGQTDQRLLTMSTGLELNLMFPVNSFGIGVGGGLTLVMPFDTYGKWQGRLGGNFWYVANSKGFGWNAFLNVDRHIWKGLSLGGNVSGIADNSDGTALTAFTVTVGPSARYGILRKKNGKHLFNLNLMTGAGVFGDANRDLKPGFSVVGGLSVTLF